MMAVQKKKERRIGEKNKKRKEKRDYGSQMAERMGNLAGIRRLLDRFQAVQNDVVSLGKTLHPTCLRGNVPVLILSRSR